MSLISIWPFDSVIWEIFLSESEIPRDMQRQTRKYAFLKGSRAVQSCMKTGPSRLLLFANDSLYKCMSQRWIQPDILTQLRGRISIVRLMRESRQSRRLGQRRALVAAVQASVCLGCSISPQSLSFFALIISGEAVRGIGTHQGPLVFLSYCSATLRVMWRSRFHAEPL